MKRSVSWLSLVLMGLLAPQLFGQPPIGGSLEQTTTEWAATTVQLPTFSFFSVRTTVLVPDRGSAYLGGIKRAASGRSEFGVPMFPFRPLKNTAIGRQMSASNMQVTATIHDLEAMDEFLLSRPTSFSQSLRARPPRGVGYALAYRGANSQPMPRRDMLKHNLRPYVPRNPTPSPAWDASSVAAAGRQSLISLAEARSRRLKQQEMRAEEAADFFQRGQKAEAAGKTGVAKIYYRMAARRATGKLQDRAAARLEAIDQRHTRPGREAHQATAAQIAQNRP